MTKQKTLVASLATAISPIALLTCPALAQALPTIPLAPPCGQYGFSGLTILNQSNGYRLEFNANGPQLNAPVTAFNNRQAVANRGTANGDIQGRAVSFRVTWNNGSGGEYTGAVDDGGMARGETWAISAEDTGTATWNFKDPLACAV